MAKNKVYSQINQYANREEEIRKDVYKRQALHWSTKSAMGEDGVMG